MIYSKPSITVTRFKSENILTASSLLDPFKVGGTTSGENLTVTGTISYDNAKAGTTTVSFQ